MAKLIGLIGSAHDGEISAAARAAERYRLNLPGRPSWEEIIAGPTVEPGALRELAALRIDNGRLQRENDALRDRVRQLEPKAPPASLAVYIAEFATMLSDWERGFLQDITDRARALSPKQIAVVERIEARTGRVVPLPAGLRPNHLGY